MRFPTLLLLIPLVAGCTWEKPPSETLMFGPHALPVEVAASMGERRRGLMGRDALPNDQGMLFIFPSAGKKCMWMKNTQMPLSTVFLDAQGVIINLVSMQAESLDIHCSNGIASYAVEANIGWFETRGVREGDQVSGLPPAPATRAAQ